MRDKIDKPVFVFGSNRAGRHGKGAALHARKHCGAIYGVGEGLQGRSYAIPTKDERLAVLPLHIIRAHVDRFVIFARAHPELDFSITAIGTGLAGYRHDEIAPMFIGVPRNCALPDEWRQILAAMA